MGLDMYLYKKTYITTGNWIKEEFREDITVTKGGKPHPEIKNSRIRYVVEEVGYWRKANHIHKWFVENVQNGMDDCGTYQVSRSKLGDLLDICEEVMKDNSKANELLPTTSGCFFGSTEYGEYYFEDVQQTIGILEECLSGDADIFEYHSSW